jgi:hypothetical protein
MAVSRRLDGHGVGFTWAAPLVRHLRRRNHAKNRRTRSAAMTPPAMALLLVDFFDIAANADAEGSGDPDCALISIVRIREMSMVEWERDRTESADADPVART